jgi:hypothetical protein
MQGRNQLLAREVGFEPTNGGFKGRCLTTWLLPNADVDLLYFSFYTHECPDRAGRIIPLSRATSERFFA